MAKLRVVTPNSTSIAPAVHSEPGKKLVAVQKTKNANERLPIIQDVNATGFLGIWNMDLVYNIL